MCFPTPYPSSTGQGFLQTEVMTPVFASNTTCRSLSDMVEKLVPTHQQATQTGEHRTPTQRVKDVRDIYSTAIFG